MSTLSLRLPESLHKKVKELAQQEGVSINQFVTVAVAEKLSALLTEDYLQERARLGSRSRYEAALDQVPDVEPNPMDTIDPVDASFQRGWDEAMSGMTTSASDHGG